jgi:hypothetical protein
MVVIEGAPHGMLATHADEVNQALIDFLSGRKVGNKAMSRTDVA